jgi:5-formyltetrahydrofolate cyclo-ligase
MPVRIGVCHDWQVRDKQLPVEAHDVPMDMLITDDKLYCSPELESK